MSQVMTTDSYNVSGEKIYSRAKEVYKYTRQDWFKSRLIQANDKAKDDKNFVKEIQLNLYMDEFLMSVRTLQELIETCREVRNLFS